MTLSPPNAAHLSEALGADTARAVLAGKRLVSRPVQITLEELERLMNVATRRGANDDGL